MELKSYKHMRQVLYRSFRSLTALRSLQIRPTFTLPIHYLPDSTSIFNNSTRYQFSNNQNQKKPVPQDKSTNQQQPKQTPPKDQEPPEKEENQKKQQTNKQTNANSQKSTHWFDNFWEEQDPKDPKKKPPSKLEQLWKKFENQYGKLVDYLRIWYYRKFSISSIVLGILLLTMISYNTHSEVQLSSAEFSNFLKTGSFQEIEFIEEEYFGAKRLKAKRVEGKMNRKIYFCYVLNFDEILSQVTQDSNPIQYRNVNRSGFEAIMHKFYMSLDVISLVIIIGSIAMASKNGQMNGRMGQSMNPSKKFQVTSNIKVKFADVAGMDESKREVREVVDFLTHPQKYHNLGASIPKGVLLTGPPGTGKTLLAKACAGEAGVPFYSVSGSDFVQVFVGVGASRVRDLFDQAKKNSPSIIFIDQLDAVGKKRQNKLGSNDERESTLNQLLVEMDGFGTNSSVIVMGATNRKEILDNALVRAGRFDREVEVNLPDLKGRYEILLVHLKPLQLSPKFTSQEYAKRIASLTPGFSGAELANLCNEAAILAARCAKDMVEMMDFQLSSERVIGGVERKGFVSMKEKKIVAYHESGHAVVSWFLEGADPLLKVTIIPRSKGALGFAQYFVNENQLQTKEQLMDRICFILGGRCSEQHFFNEVTTGAYDDLEKAYNLAYHIVAKFGMDSELGYIAFPDIQYTKPYGEKVESLIDSEIKKIIAECTAKTKAMVKSYEHHIKNLSEELLVKETLDVRSLQKILGKRPFNVNKTFEAYLETETMK